MHSDLNHTFDLIGDEQEVEMALRALPISTPRNISRDRAFFDAGMRAGRRRSWAWQGASGVLMVLLIMFAATKPRERKVYVHVEPPDIAMPSPETAESPVQASPRNPDTIAPLLDYPAITLRNRVIQFGLDGLPKPIVGGGASRDMTLEDIMKFAAGRG